MIRIKTYASRHEADFAAERLKEAGIESVLKSDDISGAYPGVTGVKLYVAESNFDEANLILSSESTALTDQPIEEKSQKAQGFLLKLRAWLKGD